MNTTDIILKAKNSVDGNLNKLILIGIVVALLNICVQTVGFFTIPALVDMLFLPIWVSQAMIYLKVVRGQQFAVGDVTLGFKNYITNMLTILFSNVFTLLWSCLLIIPGIIKWHAYAMAPFIISENPEMKPVEAITQSRKMMNGHKMQLFMAYLTVVGWAIVVSLITTGAIALVSMLLPALSGIAIFIGLAICISVTIYAYPLYYAIVAQFYVELSGTAVATNANDDFSNKDDIYYNDNAQEKLNSSKDLYYENDED